MVDFELVILGAGDHGKIVHDILETEKKHYRVAGFVDLYDNKEIWQRLLLGKPVFGGPDKLEELLKRKIQYAAIAVGNSEIREKYFREVESKGFQIVSAIHPAASVSKSAYIGKGASISAGAVICPGARLGEGVIVNTGATVDHDCWVGDFATICPGVHLAGHVKIGEGAFIGIGATIAHPKFQTLTIGKNAVVSAGSVVLKDVKDGETVYGNPAKVKRAAKTKTKS